MYRTEPVPVKERARLVLNARADTVSGRERLVLLEMEEVTFQAELKDLLGFLKVYPGAYPAAVRLVFTFITIYYVLPFPCLFAVFHVIPYLWRLEVDARRTTQPLEISLFVKLYRKRSMGALISLGEPINETLPYDKGILSRNRIKSIKNPLADA